MATSLELGSPERKFIFAVAMKIVKNEIDADDVTQNAMLRAYQAREQFRGESKFNTWLYRIAVTSALMHLRKKRRRTREVELTVEELALPSQQPSPEQQLGNREILLLVNRQLAGLGLRTSGIFWDKILSEATDTELAEDYKLSTSAVKSRTFRARKHLRQSLGQRIAV